MKAPKPETARSASGLSVRLGSRLVIERVSLELRRRELLALVGPNGAGKTTLVRALAGLLPAQGTITIEACGLDRMTPRERARRIAYLPQGHLFHWPMPVADIVALGRHPYADSISGLTAKDVEAVNRAMRSTGVEAFAERSVLALSGGERARVALARALATEAPILLADEPTAALDARHQLIVMALLRRVAEQGGAVLAIVHDLTLAARYADRIAVIDRGRIVADAPPAEALTKARIAEVFGVEAVAVDAPEGPILIPHRPL